MYGRYFLLFFSVVSLCLANPARVRTKRPFHVSSKVVDAEGHFTMTGDEGDWVTGGASYTYDINQGDILRISADTTGRGVSLSITGYNGDWFDMDLKAAEGKRLEAGEYFNATRAPFSGAGPGIDIGGNGRGCNTILGHFIVIESKITDKGEVELLDAAFAQHCEGGQTALRGRVRIVNSGNPCK